MTSIAPLNWCTGDRTSSPPRRWTRITIAQAIDETRDYVAAEEVNSQHKLGIASSELDSSTKRIIECLSEEFEIRINAT
jgi:hypothetical protein